MTNTNKGKLIVLDGIDGSGKATQTKLLVERLRAGGKHVETLDFPQYDHNFFGGMVRQYLQGAFGDATQLNPRLASILYAADRWESSAKLKTWLDEGAIVILDRYVSSNLIHQSTKLEPDQLEPFVQWVEKMEFEVFGIPRPDQIIFLHLPPEVSLELITQRGRGHDGHERLSHLAVAEQRALWLAQRHGWTTISCIADGTLLPPEKIHEQIWETAQKV